MGTVFSRETKGLSLESRLHFWALLGPFFILAAIFVSTIRFIPTGAYMPFLLLLTLPICWYKKKRLVFLAVGLCFAMFLFSYSRIPHEYRVWEMGMLLTVGLGLLITVLSLKEISQMLSDFQQEAKSRLDNLMRIDEKLKQAEGVSHKQEGELEEKLQLATEKMEQVQQETEMLKAQLREAVEEKKSLQLKLDNYSKSVDEWESQSYKMKKSFEESELKRQKTQEEKDNIQAKMDALSMSIQGDKQRLAKEKQEFHVFQLTANQKQIEMKKMLEENIEKLNELSAHVEELVEEKEALEKKAELFAQDKSRFRNALNAARSEKFQLKVIVAHQGKLLKMQAKKRSQASSVNISKEGKNYEHLYRQLRKQFQEKDRELTKARHALFHSEEEKLKIKKEQEMLACEPMDIIDAAQRDLQKQEVEKERLEKEVKDLNELVELLSQKDN